MDDHDDHEESADPGMSDRCTPEKLLAFIEKTRAATGKMPTLGACKAEFGGIIGPMIDYWALKRKGLV